MFALTVRRALTLLMFGALAVASTTVIGHQQAAPRFKVVAFYTGVNDLAHISFVREANTWFPEVGRTRGFSYESTNDWSNLNAESLSRYQVVVFLDTRPDDPAQLEAFREGKTNRELSSTFAEPVQNELITQALLWLGSR